MDPMPGADGWAGLSFLRPKILTSVRKLFPNPFTFSNSFDGEDDAHSLLLQLSVVSGVDFQTLEGEATKRLIEWSESQQPLFKRQKRMVASDLEYSLFQQKPFQVPATVDVFESIVKD